MKFVENGVAFLFDPCLSLSLILVPLLVPLWAHSLVLFFALSLHYCSVPASLQFCTRSQSTGWRDIWLHRTWPPIMPHCRRAVCPSSSCRRLSFCAVRGLSLAVGWALQRFSQPSGLWQIRAGLSEGGGKLSLEKIHAAALVLRP